MECNCHPLPLRKQQLLVCLALAVLLAHCTALPLRQFSSSQHVRKARSSRTSGGDCTILCFGRYINCIADECRNEVIKGSERPRHCERRCIHRFDRCTISCPVFSYRR